MRDVKAKTNLIRPPLGCSQETLGHDMSTSLQHFTVGWPCLERPGQSSMASCKHWKLSREAQTYGESLS